MLVIHFYRVQAVNQFRQRFHALFKQRFQLRDKIDFPAFRWTAAGLPDQSLVSAGFMNVAIAALG